MCVDNKYTKGSVTFYVVQCVAQHSKHTHIEGIAECFIVEVDSRIGLEEKGEEIHTYITMTCIFNFLQDTDFALTSVTSATDASRLFKKESETNIFT